MFTLNEWNYMKDINDFEALYRRRYVLGMLRRGLDRLFGRARVLPVAEGPAPRARHLGVQAVPLAEIHGSTQAEPGFDARFNPTSLGGEHRWIQIAVAMQSGRPYPPVVVHKVGAGYLVEQGQASISVARALGLTDIDAEVILSAPAPEQTVTPAEGREAIPQARYAQG
jgi:hypothetical protein